MQVLSRIRQKLSEWEAYQLLLSFQQALNGGIEIGTVNNPTINLKGKIFTGTSPGVADTEFSITHNFGYIPTGWLLLSIDKASILYKGVTAWSTKTVSLKFNQATVTYVLFLT